MKCRVVIAKAAYYEIKRCMIDVGNHFEIGGVLIGYKFGQTYFVVAVTIADSNNADSKVSFILDGDEHTKKASQIIDRFRYKPSVLGVWHSHICDGAIFSEQDRCSNRALAQTLDGTLSMLITMSQQKISLAIYFISPDGEECYCKTRIFRKYQKEGHDR